MSRKSCLNCGHFISGEYCSHCGQKSDTERITPKLLIMNDILGSVWHIEARFLNTLKEILIRPGITATNYLSGKRIRYYNFVSLLLIMFGFNVIAFHLYLNISKTNLDLESSKTLSFFSKYSKATLLFLVPILAFNAWIIFRKIKFNLAEHFVISTISLIGILTFFLVDDLVSMIGVYQPFYNISNSIDHVLETAFVFFPAFTYVNAFRKKYTFWGLVWRLVLFYVLVFSEILAIVLFINKL